MFVAGPGDVEQERLEHAELFISEGAPHFAKDVQAIGLATFGLGFILMVLSFRRGSPSANPNSQPPPPRWGRNAG